MAQAKLSQAPHILLGAKVQGGEQESPEQLKNLKAREPFGHRDPAAPGSWGLPKPYWPDSTGYCEKAVAPTVPRGTGNAKWQVAEITVAQLQAPDSQGAWKGGEAGGGSHSPRYCTGLTSADCCQIPKKFMVNPSIMVCSL